MVTNVVETMDEGGPYLEFDFMGRHAVVEMEQKWLWREIDAVFLGKPFDDVFADISVAGRPPVRYNNTTDDPEVVRIVKEWWNRVRKGA